MHGDRRPPSMTVASSPPASAYSTDAVPACPRCSRLEAALAELQATNARLRAQLQLQQEPPAIVPERESAEVEHVEEETVAAASVAPPCSAFSRLELQRYGRQMLVKEFGVAAQLKLRAASVLLIGAGGLGSPVALYLAAMGVGTLAVVDDDVVDRSNLHRQVLHDEQAACEREKKVDSAQRRLRELNPLLHFEAHATRFTAANALSLVNAHDVIVDATDNVGTRYLVNDVCARLKKPLVSGSALGLEGQVTVFTYQDDKEATGCYRCLYPIPPRAAMSCAENGVLGVVPGVIGCLQAMETVKIITGVGEPLVGVQCFYDAYDGQFRRIKIGKKRDPDCLSCGTTAGDDKTSGLGLDASLLLEGSCKSRVPLASDLAPEFRISVAEFEMVRREALTTRNYVLLDTRARNQFEMAHFPEAVNVPYAQLMKQDPDQVIQEVLGVAAEDQAAEPTKQVFVICRRGVDSVRTTQWLVRSGLRNVRNVDGGYTEYAKEGGVDPTFPMY
ncbi:hypothetical protein BBJ28_00003781 [Nothophytophthora sp. Chile5]|nr:hypothetical protein BBJ28_00003781 [Nothophytophthora sp. Chile5]